MHTTCQEKRKIIILEDNRGTLPMKFVEIEMEMKENREKTE